MEKPISKFDNNTHKHKSTYVHKKTKKKTINLLKHVLFLGTILHIYFLKEGTILHILL